nr:hypothetical protein [Deltaproteobacteria bacterium]
MRILTTSLFLGLMTALVGCGSVVIQADPDGGLPGDAPAVTDRPPNGDVPLPPVDRPLVVDVPPVIDVPRTCTSSADCAGGTVCLGPEGCAIPWTCQPALGRPCTDDLSPFCGCDGRTYYGSSSCPSQPYLYRGSCDGPPPPVDAGPPPRTCQGNVDCAAGSMCTGPEGCGIPWTCQPAPPCTRDLTSYCVCDGTSFMASSTCPGRPYLRRGACGIIPPPPDAGPGYCTISGVMCRIGVPCRIDACTTCTCGGDTVACAIDPGCGMDGGTEPPPICPPQDARAVGACALFLGYAWNGAECIGLSGCSCSGAECRSLYRDPMQCEIAHRLCPRPL